jgi:hypothetical protein
MRLDGWEKRILEVAAKHKQLPSQYGLSDCYTIADDMVFACLGEYMYPKAKNYKTESGAAKLLRKHGFKTVKDALSARFDEVPTSLAQRGDVGVLCIDGVYSGGAFTSIGFMTRGEGTVEFLPASAVSHAYKVI